MSLHSHLKQYCGITPWRIPVDGNYFYVHALLDFSALCPDGYRHHFHAYGNGVINEKERKKNNIQKLADIEKIGELKIKTAIMAVVGLCERSLGEGCLIHPVVHALMGDDRHWLVSPWETHKLNKPWRAMAKKEDLFGYWIPVHDVMVHDPRRAREVPLNGV